MKNIITSLCVSIIGGFGVGVGLGVGASAFISTTSNEANPQAPAPPATQPVQKNNDKEPGPAMEPAMELGNFSVSLTVKDLEASRAFYEKLGFRARGGDAAKGWLILQNDTAIVGLFHGMFERNMLTFNPGWDRDKNTLAKFQDVRDIQKSLKAKGVKFSVEADEKSTGPAYFMIADPDGNPILVDQAVPRPAPK